MPTAEYSETLLASVKKKLTAEEWDALHITARGSAGGKVRARMRREAAQVLKAETDDGDEGFDADDLDPDVYGAMFELSEFAGLTGDEGVDAQFQKLPKEVQLAIHTISNWCEWDEEAAEGDAEKIEKAEPDASDVGPIGLMNGKKTKPHAFTPMDGSPKLCATCGQPAGYIAHKGKSLAAKAVQAVKKAAGRDKIEGSFEDIQAQLTEALRAKYASSLGNSYVYTRSTNDTSVAFTVDGGPSSGSYQCDYTIKDGKVVLGEPKPVEFRTVAVAKAFDIVSDAPIWIEKGEKEKQHIVYGVVLSPGIKDSHGDRVTAEDIEKAAHAFLIKQQRQAVNKGAHNRQHIQGTVDAEPVESYIAPVDFEITSPAGKTMTVLKGAWVMASKVHDTALFSEIEKGEKVTGFSIEGTGLRFEDAA